MSSLKLKKGDAGAAPTEGEALSIRGNRHMGKRPMSNIPDDLKYKQSNEWVSREANGNARIGITDHAQEALGDLVFVELPAVGDLVDQGDSVSVVESVKAASDIYAPVAGDRDLDEPREDSAAADPRPDQEPAAFDGLPA